MNVNSHFIRTAAVLFAEENFSNTSQNINKKIIESILVQKDNEEHNIHDLLDILENEIGLVFDEDEVIKIINSDNKDCFVIRINNGEKCIKLEAKRYKLLKEKEKDSLEKYIDEFSLEIYNGEMSSKLIHELLHKYFYEVLNNNILSFQKLLFSKCKSSDISMEMSSMSNEERLIINNFIDWDNVDKNKALFKLLSYCIEYILVSNNTDGQKFFINALKNKVFYLDNNIIYRAIGINGDFRKKRMAVFLDKCLATKQKFVVSKFTYQEFKETIDHHIKLLADVPFGKINPKLFKKYSINSGIYEFYHKWRSNRLNYGFDLFRAHIHSLYKDFLVKYNVEEDYKISFSEKDKDVINVIDQYSQEIKSFKGKGGIESHKFDAWNTFLLEQKRGANNYSIKDTKYYFISSDQRLRDWDYTRNDDQPLAILPAQWMNIILRFVSRTNDDFKSFVGFLKLTPSEPIVSSDELQIILSGISEITEDFEGQESILDAMVESQFENVLANEDYYTTRENSKRFAKSFYDKKILSLKEDYQQKLTVKEMEILEKEKGQIELLLSEVQESIDNKEILKKRVEKKTQKKYNNYCLMLGGVFLLYLLALVFFVYKYSWEVMEPVTYFLTIITILITYLYSAISLKELNPLSFFRLKKQKIKQELLKEFSIEQTVLDNQIAKMKELQAKITQIEEKIVVN